MSSTEKIQKTQETTNVVKTEKDCFVDLLGLIQNIKQQLTTLSKAVKETEKKVNKKIKVLEKNVKNLKIKETNNHPVLHIHH